IQEQTVVINLPTGYSSVVTFPNINVPAGVNVLKFWTASPNAGTDQAPANDTLTLNISVGVGIVTPVTENFSSTTFPPPGWSLARVAGATANAAWQRRASSSSGAPGSAFANLYSISSGNVFDLRSPLISTTQADTMVISFDVAHRQYSTSQDTLKLMVSPDCGATFIQIWQEWSSQLSNGVSGTAELTAPTASQWKTVTVKIPNSPATQNILSNPNLLFAWRAVSRIGNNIFLDNINISKIFILRRDLQPLSFAALPANLCDGNNVRPSVIVRNAGADTIKSFKVNYQVNGAATVVVNWTGSVAKNETTTVDLNTANYTPGVYTLKMWTSEPNGLADQLPSNDTITFTFTVLAITQAPLVEGFEGTFPPPNWLITQQPADAFTWAKTTSAARRGLASAYVNDFLDTAFGKIDNLLTPPVRYSGADSLFFKFDVAAATYNYPGSTATPLDTLEVLMSTDCGNTFRSIYKKWGVELQTIADPNNVNTNEFFPIGTYQWRTDSINVTNILGSANTVRFMFKSIANSENNIFIDNVNFTPKVVPARLKSNGFMITPNPFTTTFFVQHYLAPTNLRGMGVYNSIGQLVVSRSFTGQADSFMEVNMGRLPAGVYTVKLIYTNRTISQKVIKIQ
ncbi:MAG: hypothetical protein JWQ96_1109, partial [Segetibacter sp.]|nr:hypothetical protein [Segetibacter sp.]